VVTVHGIGSATVADKLQAAKVLLIRTRSSAAIGLLPAGAQRMSRVIKIAASIVCRGQEKHCSGRKDQCCRTNWNLL
jgi:hypothetical protein